MSTKRKKIYSWRERRVRYIISIIVPIYKVEKYLETCINSILSQTFTNFELILVDDGSPDRCGFICDEYKKRIKG